MSNQARKRVRRALGLEVSRQPLPAFAWPGGYPLYYPFSDGGVCCPECVNREIVLVDDDMRDARRFGCRPRRGGFAVESPEANYEDADLVCDHCGQAIPAAYAD